MRHAAKHQSRPLKDDRNVSIIHQVINGRGGYTETQAGKGSRYIIPRLMENEE